MNYTLEELKILTKEYLDTLDDSDLYEGYTTDKEFQKYGVEEFIKWLEKSKKDKDR